MKMQCSHEHLPRNSLTNYNFQKQPFGGVKKGILRNVAKSTGKHLCQSLFFNKVAGLSPESL